MNRGEWSGFIAELVNAELLCETHGEEPYPVIAEECRHCDTPLKDVNGGHVCTKCGCIFCKGEVVSNINDSFYVPPKRWPCAIGEYELATAPEAKA